MASTGTIPGLGKAQDAFTRAYYFPLLNELQKRPDDMLIDGRAFTFDSELASNLMPAKSIAGFNMVRYMNVSNGNTARIPIRERPGPISDFDVQGPVASNNAIKWVEFPIRHWVNRIEINRDDMDDLNASTQVLSGGSQMALFDAMQDLAEQFAYHPQHRLAYLLDNLTSAAVGGACDDNQAFLASAHFFKGANGTTYSNYTTSTALTYANVWAQYNAMRSRKGRDGQLIRCNPNAIIVPQTLAQQASEIKAQILSAQNGSQGTTSVAATNIMQGKFEVIVIPQLTTTTRWYLADLSSPSLAWALRKQMNFVPLISPNDPNVYNHNKFSFQADFRGEAGHTGQWWLVNGVSTT